MTQLYFIRHGETDWNATGKYQGWSDVPLSEQGRKQAECLGKRFESVPLDVIYSSPLKRAYDTAKAVADKKAMTIIPDEHFKEINFGDWEGLTAHQLKELYGEKFQYFLDHPEDAEFPGEGSFSLVMERIKIGLDTVLEENQGKNIMIVSHGGLIRLCIFYLTGMDIRFYKQMWINNTAVSVVRMTSYGAILYKVNDDAHIENLK